MPRIYFQPTEERPTFAVRIERENGGVEFVTFSVHRASEVVSQDSFERLLAESKCFTTKKVEQAKPPTQKVAQTPGDVSNKASDDDKPKPVRIAHRFDTEKKAEVWYAECPSCKSWAAIDDDQRGGKVSLECPTKDCGFHDMITVNGPTVKVDATEIKFTPSGSH